MPSTSLRNRLISFKDTENPTKPTLVEFVFTIQCYRILIYKQDCSDLLVLQPGETRSMNYLHFSSLSSVKMLSRTVPL